jgi:hypothetical protein
MKWATREIDLDLNKYVPIIAKFIKHNFKPLWEDGEKEVEQLMIYLKENRLYRQLEKQPIVLSERSWAVGPYIITSPSLLPKTTFTVPPQKVRQW